MSTRTLATLALALACLALLAAACAWLLPALTFVPIAYTTATPSPGAPSPTPTPPSGEPTPTAQPSTPAPQPTPTQPTSPVPYIKPPMAVCPPGCYAYENLIYRWLPQVAEWRNIPDPTVAWWWLPAETPVQVLQELDGWVRVRFLVTDFYGQAWMTTTQVCPPLAQRAPTMRFVIVTPAPTTTPAELPTLAPLATPTTP